MPPLFTERLPKVLAMPKPPRQRSSGGRRGGGGSDPRLQRMRLALQSERLALQQRNAERNWAYKVANLQRMRTKDAIDSVAKLHNILGKAKPQTLPAPRINLGGAVNKATNVGKAADQHIAKGLEILRGSGIPYGLWKGVGAIKPRGGRQK